MIFADIKQKSSIVGNFFLDLIFPKKCVNCGEYGSFCCPKCLAKIKPIQTQVCPKCGKISERGQWCPECKGESELTGIIVGAVYRAGPTKEMIHYLKYNSVTELAPKLADLLIDQLIDEDLPKNIIITAVPLHRRKELERGFNQSEMVAKIVAKKLGISYQTLLSRKRYDKKSQVKLKGDARRKNLIDAFGFDKSIKIEGKSILLVDDVSTTGTTLEECAKNLRAGGARRIWGLVVARG